MALNMSRLLKKPPVANGAAGPLPAVMGGLMEPEAPPAAAMGQLMGNTTPARRPAKRAAKRAAKRTAKRRKY